MERSKASLDHSQRATRDRVIAAVQFSVDESTPLEGSAGDLQPKPVVVHPLALSLTLQAKPCV